MNKLQNLSKFLGVVIGLLLGQAVYAQKIGTSRTPVPTTPPVAYVTGSTALSRIDTKINQYLGQLKQNNNPASQTFQNLENNRQFYVYLRAFIVGGANAQEAAEGAVRKMYQSGAITSDTKDWAGAIFAEATTLLKQ